MSSKKKHKTKKPQPPKVRAKTETKAVSRGFWGSAWFVMLVSAVLGGLLFVKIYGIKLLDPTYDGWLLTGGDLTQHYLGWLYFRRSEWNFPIGLFEGLLGDVKLSVVYTDSVPILAVLFKLISPILPDTFQYFGLLGLLSFMLNASFSSLLIRRFTKSPSFCIIGSVIYTLCPAILQRLYGHESLACHYIITASLLLWVYQDRKWGRNKILKYAVIPLLWGILGALAVGTHVYFVPMIFCSLFGSFITDICINREFSRPLFSFSAVTVTSTLTLWLLGAFYGGAEVAESGFGENSANLNTFWNPIKIGGHNLAGVEADSSIFLKPLPMREYQYEGFAYLGVGAMIALAAALAVVVYCLVKKKERIFGDSEDGARRKAVWLFAGIAVFITALFFALSPNAYFGTSELYHITYPDKIASMLATFRASGRFAWVCDYLIFTFALYGLSRLKSRHLASLLLAVCMVIQVADISGMTKSKDWFKTDLTYHSKLTDERWEKLAEGCDKFDILPYDQHESTIFLFTKYAYDHGMTINHFYVARPDNNAIAEQYNACLEALNSGAPDPKTLYVFVQEDLIPKQSGLKVYELDGFKVVKFPEQFDPLEE